MGMDVTSLSVRVESKGIKEASSQLSGLSTSANNATKRIDTLTQSVSKLERIQLAAIASHNSYLQALQASGLTVTMVTSNTAGLQSAVNRLVASIHTLSASMGNLGVQSQTAAASMSFHTNAMKDAHAAARGLTGSLGALWVTYGSAVPLAAGLAIGTSLKGIVLVGKSVENTLEGIRVRGQESIESINAIRESVINLGQGVYGPVEVAKAFDILILAGLNAKQSLAAVKDALNLALVGGTTIEKAATVLVQVGTSLGYTAEGYSRIADVIAMTAAASVASVESISESFKSGSAVGKLYGVTLVDIGTQFALLSNLGIKGSAAGTAVKNFYSDLASGSKKVTDGLAAAGLSIEDLKDKAGNFKSFSEVMSTLSGGLNTLTEANQKLVIAQITNERGSKLMVEGLSLVRKAGTETATALDDLTAKIENSYGMAAMGAAAMALTIDSQLKSVKNTLETQFLKAFQEIEPQISVVASRLKSAFNSPEFSEGLQSIALSLANLSVAVVENISFLKTLFEIFLLFKGASFIVGLVMSFGEALLVITKVLEGAKFAAIAFQASLGLVGIALAATAAAYVWYKSKKDEAAHTQAQIQYMDDFIGKLDEESDRLRKQIELMKQKKTASEAANEVAQFEALAKVKLNGETAIADKVRESANIKEKMNQAELDALDRIQRGKSTLADRDINSVKSYLKSVQAVNATMLQVEEKNNRATAALKIQRDLAKEHAAIADQQAKDFLKNNNAGTGELPVKVNKKGESDALHSELNNLQNEIDRAKRELTATESALQSQYKQGLIGEIGLITQKGMAQEKYDNAAINLLKEKIALASKGDKAALLSQLRGEEEKGADKALLRAQEITQKTAEYYSKMEVDILKDKVDGLKAQGKFVDAFLAENEAKYTLSENRLKADLETLQAQAASATKELLSATSTEDVDKFSKSLVNTNKHISEVQNRLTAISEGKAFGVLSSKIKESDNAVRQMLSSLDASVETIKAEYSNGSIISKLFDASNLSDLYSRELPAVLEKLNQLKVLSESAGASSEDKKKYDDELKSYKKHLKDQRDVYKEFTDYIDKAGMDGLEALMSKEAGAWSKFTNRLKNDFKKALVDEIYKMFVKDFVVKVFASVTGASIASSAGSSTIGNTVGSMVGSSIGALTIGGSTLAAIGSSVSAGVQAGFAGVDLTGAISAYNAAGLAGQAGMATTATGLSVGSSIGSVIAAIPGWGWAALATAAAYQIFKGGETRSGGAYSYMGGQVVKNEGPSGGEVASTQVKEAIRGTADGISKLLLDFGSKATLSGFTAGLETSQNGKGFVFAGGNVNGTSFGETRSNVEAKGNQTAQEAIAAFELDLKQATIQALQAANLGGYIGEYLSKLGDVEKLTATEVDSIIAKIQQVQTFVVALQKMPFENLKTATADATIGLATMAGGFEALTAKLGSYYTNYYTEEEKKAQTLANVSAALSEVNIALPTTREEFRALVDGVKEVNTEAGQKTYVTLLNVADAFASVVPAANSLTTTVKDVKAETESLQARMEAANNATLTAAQLQEKERNALDATNRSLYDQIIAQENLNAANAKAASERVSLQDRYDALTMSSTQLRQKERNTISATNLTLYDAVIALEDLKTAADNAASSTSDAATTLANNTAEINSKRRTLEIALLRASGDELGAVNLERTDELASLTALSPELANMQRGLYAVTDAMAASKAAADEVTAAQAAVSKANSDYSQAASTVASNLKSVQEAFKAVVTELEEANKAVIKAGEDINKAYFDSVKTLAEKTAALDQSRTNIADAYFSAEDRLAQAKIASSEASDKAAQAMKDYGRSISEFLDTLSTTSAGSGSPESILAANRAKFNTTLAAAKSGDKNAQSNLTGVASAFLAASKDYNATNSAFTADESTVKSALADVMQMANNGLLPGAKTDEMTKADEEIIAAQRSLVDLADLAKEADVSLVRDTSNTDKTITSLRDAFNLAKSEESLARVVMLDLQNFAKLRSIDITKNTLDTVHGIDDLKIAYDSAVTAQIAANTKYDEALVITRGISMAVLDGTTGLRASVEAYNSSIGSLASAASALSSAASNLVTASANAATANASLAVAQAEANRLAQAAGTTGTPTVTPNTTPTNTPNSANPAISELTTVNDLYQSILNRVPDAGGLQFWTNTFGDSVDAAEITNFLAAAGPELASRVNGSHANGLNKVPFDNYVANLHSGERVLTASEATASDELVELTKQLLAKISNVEGNTSAVINQNAAIAQMNAELLNKLSDNQQKTNRKLASV